MSARVISPVLVGREAELAALHAALDARGSDDRPVVIVEGDAGIGKSRLLAEFVRSLPPGTMVGAASCFRVAEGDLPYAGVLGILDDLERCADPAMGSALAAARHALTGVGEESDGVRPDVARIRRFEQVLEPLRSLTRDAARPLVLVLDDVHWADSGTLDVVRFLARRLCRSRCVILLAWRAVELPAGHPVRLAVADLERDLVLAHVTLEPLEARAVAELIERLTGAMDGDRSAAVIRRAAGNPFFVEELLAASGTAPVPPTIRELLLARIHALGPDARSLVAAAAVLGRPSPIDLLLAVSGLDPDRLEVARRETHDLGVLDAPHPSSVGFRHPLLAEVAYGDLLPGRRSALHAEVAHTLAERGTGQPTARELAELAHHLDRAGDPDRALPTLVAAGRACERAFAFREALDAYERAIALGVAAGLPPVELVDLHARAGFVARQVGEARRGLDHIRTATPLVDARADPDRAADLAEAHIAMLNELGDDPEGLRVAEAAYAELGDRISPLMRLRLLLALGFQRAFAGRVRAALPVAEEAADLADALGSESGGVYAASLVARLQRDLGRAALADRGWARVRAAPTSDDPDVVEIPLVNESFDRANLGEWAAALGHLDAARAATASFGPEHAAAFEPWLLGVELEVALQRGDIARARAVVDRMIEARDSNPTRAALAEASWVAALSGDGRGSQRVGASSPLGGPLDVAFHLAGTALARTWVGDHDEALRLVSEARTTLDGYEGISHPARIHVVGVVVAAHAADAARAARDRRAMRRALHAGLPSARVLRRHDRGDAGPDAEVVLVNRARGAFGVAEWRHALGRDDETAWSWAIDLLDAVELRFEAAYARWRLGAHLFATHRERTAATRLLRDAHEYAAAEDAAPLRERVEAVASAAAISLEPLGSAGPAASGDPWGLSPREREVVELVAAGCTNREIGERLFITEKTASSHVTHILDKLGVASRVEAALLAARSGIGEASIRHPATDDTASPDALART